MPILLMANIFLGIYYNQSVWYKLTEKTSYGAGLAIFGAIITLVLNMVFIPKYGYMASAWATLICYASMMIASYFLGRKYYPVPYELGKIGAMIGVAALLYWATLALNISRMQFGFAINLIFLLGYAVFSWFLLRPLKK